MLTFTVLSIVIFMLISMLAARCRSIQHIIIYKRFERSRFTRSPQWFQDFLTTGSSRYQTLDGDHLFGGLNDLLNTLSFASIGIMLYLWTGSTKSFLLFMALASVGWFVWYYFCFNFFFHIRDMLKNERKLWQCIPGLIIFGL